MKVFFVFFAGRLLENMISTSPSFYRGERGDRLQSKIGKSSLRIAGRGWSPFSGWRAFRFRGLEGMHADDIALLEWHRERLLEKIAWLEDPATEEGFRQWAMSFTAPRSSEVRVQLSRTSEHAERLADMMLDYGRKRDEKIRVYEREIERIDMVLDGLTEFVSPLKALMWCREK